MIDIVDFFVVVLLQVIVVKQILFVEVIEVVFVWIEVWFDLNVFVIVVVLEVCVEVKVVEVELMVGKLCGLFYGIFYLVKDLINMVGVWIMNGLKVYEIFVLIIDVVFVVWVCVVGGVMIGKIIIFEFGYKFEVILFVLGCILYLMYFDCMLGVFLLGFVVVVCVGMGLFFIGFDGGGLICILVVCCGIVGLKLMFGMVLYL